MDECRGFRASIDFVALIDSGWTTPYNKLPAILYRKFSYRHVLEACSCERFPHERSEFLAVRCGSHRRLVAADASETLASAGWIFGFCWFLIRPPTQSNTSYNCRGKHPSDRTRARRSPSAAILYSSRWKLATRLEHLVGTQPSALIVCARVLLCVCVPGAGRETEAAAETISIWVKSVC